MGAQTLEHVQSVFTGGEQSPRLRGRVETEIYRKGLESCLNWEILPQGGLRRAPGTTFKRSMPGVVRLIPFRLQSGQDALLAFGDKTLAIFDSDGNPQVQSAGSGFTTEYLSNGSFVNYLTSWAHSGYVAVSMDGLDPYCKFTTDSYATPYIEQILTLPAGTYTLSFKIKNMVADGSAPALAVAVGTAPGDNGIGAWIYGSAGSQSVQFTTNGGTIYLRFTMPATLGGRLMAGWQVWLDTISVRSYTPTSDAASPWSAAQAPSIQWAAWSGEDKAILVHPNVQPYELRHNTDGTWTLVAVTFANPPVLDPAIVNSTTPAWAGTTWPGAVEIWQGRLWLAGWPTQRNRIWASRSGRPYDFAIQTEQFQPDGVTPTTTPPTYLVKASDAIDESLSTKGGVLGLRGRNVLVVGTDLGEGVIAAQSGAVTPLDFHYQQEAAYGFAPVQPEDIGDQIVYVSGDRRKVRALNYSIEPSAWVSHDVTFIAEHVTSAGVAELHFARDPNCTLVAILQDGTLACCTYDRGEQVAAWWRRDTSSGQDRFVSAAVLNGPQGSIVYFLVSRSGQTLLERMPMSEFATGRVYCDAAVEVDVSAMAEGATVPGFAHLAGRLVTVVLDGAVEDDQTVGGDGTIVLPRAGSSLVAGVNYRSVARTLPPEHAQPGTTIQRGKTRWVKLWARINGSAQPLIGGRRAPDRTTSTNLDTAQPGYTGDVGPFSTGWEDQGRVTIEQDQPLRTELLAIFGSLQNNVQ